jgi:phage terminase small subunit
MIVANKGELTHRQYRFAQEFVIDFNAAKAAIRAGYSAKTARVIACQNLTKANVAAEVDRLCKRVAEAAEVTSIEVLRQAERICRADLRKVFSTDGTLLPPDQWPDDIAGAISSVEVSEQSDVVGEDESTRVVAERTKKIKLWDKNSALDKLFRYHGLYRHDNEQVTPVPQELSIHMTPEEATALYRERIRRIPDATKSTKWP